MKGKSQLLLTVIFILAAESLFAVTAAPGFRQYIQPDGSSLMIKLFGDERIHWAETSDGYTILSDKSGTYVYAIKDKSGNLTFSAIPARDPANRTHDETAFLASTDKHLFFSSSQTAEMKNLLKRKNGNTDAPLTGGFPTTGTRKMLMILANFNNTTTTYPQSSFNNYMNQAGYAGTGSFRDYYLEVSYGQLTVNTTVTIWVTLPNTHDYYGPDTKWGEFAYDAVVAANNQAAVNYAEFDNDNDGTVDGIAIFHQGRGQEESGNINDIWSHSWDLYSAGYSVAQRTFDGVLVDAYTTMPEKGSSTSMGTIGVMCHEFGHNLGAPDFYDTDYATAGQYEGTGDWDLMAGGSWNGTASAGDKPAHHNAWTKIFYGWISPVVISSGQYLVTNAENNQMVYRYNTTTPNEYFLCENRQKFGFDIGLPGHGMIIYHVDGNYISLHSNNNDINAGSHQGMYPVSATSTTSSGVMLQSAGNINTSSCPWPGSSSKTSFTDVTTPWSKSWAGNNTSLPLSNISENPIAKTISFCISTCSTPLDPQSVTAIPASLSQINIAWTKNSNSDPVLVAFNTSPVFGTPVNGTSYMAGSAISGGGTVLYNGPNTTFQHTGLTPNTAYFYKVWSVLPSVQYSTGISAVAVTPCLEFIAPLTEGFESSAYTPSCWTEEFASPPWVYSTGGTNGNPLGSHSGTMNAKLSDQTTASNRNKLISPVLDFSNYSTVTLTFWHTQAKWFSDQDELRIYYRTSTGGTWNLLQTYTSSVTAWTLRTISLPSLSSSYQVAFEGDAKYGYGVCLDDIAFHASGNWIGGTAGTPTLWNVATNWDDGTVPTGLLNVYIPLRTNQPQVNVNSSVNNLTIESSATITVNPGIQLNVGGNLKLK